MSSPQRVGPRQTGMTHTRTNPVVHLELHTENLARACAFYTRLFEWRTETIELDCGSYLMLKLGSAIEGGIVERDTGRSLWLPYVGVADVSDATERASLLGASVLLGPTEGPAGWRSVIAAPSGAEIALWQPKA